MSETDTRHRKKIQTLAASPSLNAALTMQAFDKHSIDILDMRDELDEHAEAIHSGDTRRIEAMLINQATTLQNMFTNLTIKGMVQSHMPNMEGFMRLALRAQSQCRATLETLATIKAPPVVFAKQANIAHGHQQVNNTPAHAPVPAIKNQNEHNELLEATEHERLDTRTKSQASGIDSPVEAVGTQHGRTNTRRKGKMQPQR